MAEVKYSIRRGADIYEGINASRLKSWILTGKIKQGEVIVWRSGLSGYRRPEELEELKPYFHQREEQHLRKTEQQVEPTLFPRKQIKNILIIDDEEDLCWLLSNTLKKQKYHIKIANTISEALLSLEKAPDLVFLDLKLPDGNGLDILPKIREISPHTLVTIISAYGSEEIRVEAKKMGVYGFIDKPFTADRILEAIEQFSKAPETQSQGSTY